MADKVKKVRAASVYVLESVVDDQQADHILRGDEGTFRGVAEAWAYAETHELEGPLRVVCLRGERIGKVSKQYSLKEATGATE